MRIFKVKAFDRWADDEGITDEALTNAIEEMERGLIDADLGSNVYKKRVARPGQGKSGGTRTIVAFKFGDKAYFMYGFAKSKRDNISDKELKALKRYSLLLLNLNAKELEKALKNGELVEVKDE